MKYKPLIGFTIYGSNPFYIFGYTLKTKFNNMGDYFLFSLTSGYWKPPKSLNFRIFNFEFRFFAEISPIPRKKGYSAESRATIAHRFRL
jgi:hypothetical protein